jgi:hypothetical protein
MSDPAAARQPDADVTHIAARARRRDRRQRAERTAADIDVDAPLMRLAAGGRVA